MLKQLVAAALSVCLVVLAPGFHPYRLLAASFRAPPKLKPSGPSALTKSPSLLLPSLQRGSATVPLKLDRAEGTGLLPLPSSRVLAAQSADVRAEPKAVTVVPHSAHRQDIADQQAPVTQAESGAVSPAALEEGSSAVEASGAEKSPPVAERLQVIGDNSLQLVEAPSNVPVENLHIDADFTQANPNRSEGMLVPTGQNLPHLETGARATLGLAAAADSPRPNAAEVAAPEKAPGAAGQLFWGVWNLSAGIPYTIFALDMIAGSLLGWSAPSQWAWTAYPLLAYGVINLVSGAAFTSIGLRLWHSNRRGTELPERVRGQLDIYRKARKDGVWWLLGMRNPIAAFIAQIPGQFGYLWNEIAGIWVWASGLDLGKKELNKKVRKIAWASMFLSILSVASVVVVMTHSTLIGEMMNYVSGEGFSPRIGELLSGTFLSGADPLHTITGLILASLTLYFVIDLAHNFLRALTGYSLSDIYRKFLFRHAFKQDTLEQESKHGGANHLAMRNVQGSEYLMGRTLEISIEWFEYGFYFILSVLGIVLVHWQFGLVMAAYLPFSVLFKYWLGPKWKEMYAEKDVLYSDLANLSQSTFDRIPKVVAAGNVDFEVERYNALGRKLQVLLDYNVKLGGRSDAVDKGSELFHSFLVYIAGALLAAAAMGLTYGQIIQMGLFVGYLYHAVNGGMDNWLALQEARGNTELVDKLVDSEPEDDSGLPLAEETGPLSLKFKGVTYTYPDGKEVLKGVDFEIPAGKTVAMIGASASGKSTLLDSITGVLKIPADSGALEVGGTDVRQADLRELRDRIAYAEQQPVLLMNRTVRENLEAWAREDVTVREIERALKRAQADFVLERKGGLDALVTPSNRFSGGELKRLMLAGAFLREADLLILDEPTRGLDPENRREVIKSVLNTDLNDTPRTTLFVTHDMLLAAQADYVVFLKDGRIERQGTPEQLGLRAIEAEALDEAEEEEEIAEEEEEEEEGVGGVLGFLNSVAGHAVYGRLLSPYFAPLIAGLFFAALGAANIFGFPLVAEALLVGAFAAMPWLSWPLLALAGLSLSFHIVRRILTSREAAAAAAAEAEAEGAKRDVGFFEDFWTFLSGDKIFRPLLKPDRPSLLTGIFYAFIVALISAVNTNLLGDVLDWGFMGSGGGWMVIGPLLWVSSILVGFHLLGMYLNWRGWPLIGKPENRFTIEVQNYIYERLLNKDYRFYLENDPERLAEWLSEGSENIVEKNISVRVPLISSAILVAVTGISMIVINPLLGGIGVGVLILIAVLNIKLGAKSEEIYEQYTDQQTSLWGMLKGVFGSVRHHKRLNRLGPEAARVDAASTQMKKTGIRHSKIFAISGVVSSEVLKFVTYWSVLLVGAFAMAGLLDIAITPGKIIAMTMLAEYFNQGFGDFWDSYGSYKQAKGGSNRILNWLEDTSMDKPDQSGLPELPSIEGAAIEVNGVGYQYADDSPKVLDNASFQVEPGETVMMVGPSGSGKTTMLWNMMGLLHPVEGSITIGGHDISKVKEKSYIRQIGVVDQDPGLFPGTLRFNLTYGLKRKVEDSEIFEIARLAGVDFVNKETIDSQITGLSGGQTQRLNIARALLRKPKILYMDEPSSQLDPDLVDEFWESVERLKKGHPSFGNPTIVIVTHKVRRVSQFADKAVVLKDGKVVETGPPSELAEAGGVFQTLLDLDE